MRILLTNDDGIQAPGLAVLERIARTLSDDITIVAPTDEMSGAGHSLTLTRPVRLRRHGEGRWSVSGTPTDAVMMAIGEVMKEAKPDLVLSGVNRGANLAEDVTYSGTVSAAMEGTLAGVRSIALSQVYARRGAGENVSFAAAEAWGQRVLAPLLDEPWVPGTLTNINFPPVAADAVRGIKVVHQGLRDYGRLEIVKGVDPRGFPYYWFGLGRSVARVAGETDLEAVADGYVSVTPLHLDLTHGPSLERLAARYR